MAFYLDLTLQALLVLLLLIVVARGVGLVDLIERVTDGATAGGTDSPPATP